MNKIGKTIKAIVEIIKNPWLLNHVLNDDLVWQKHITKTHGITNVLPILDINQVSPEFSEELEYFAFLDGGSLPTDLSLLKALSKKFKACSYFEIGTWRGESVANVAKHAKECYTLNLSKEELLQVGLSEKMADLQGFFSKDLKNVVHLTGNTMNYDFKALNKKFDLIFIDGDHHYEFVKNDTQKVFAHLVHDQSIVVWHDYASSPEKVRPEILAGILDGIPANKKKNLYHVSNTLCAVYMVGKYDAAPLNAPITPNKVFTVSLKSRTID